MVADVLNVYLNDVAPRQARPEERFLPRPPRRRRGFGPRPRFEKLGRLMDEAEHDVLAYMTFATQHRTKLHSTDEIDKRNLHWRVIYDARERPRDEARRVGWKRRQASYSFLAGLRRSRTSPLGARVFQRSTKRA